MRGRWPATCSASCTHELSQMIRLVNEPQSLFLINLHEPALLLWPDPELHTAASTLCPSR